MILTLGVIITLVASWAVPKSKDIPKNVLLFTINMTQEKPNPIKQIVDAVLQDTKGEYSVVIKNLKTGEAYYRSEDRVYHSGSLYKLWVLAAAFNQIEKGQLKKEEELSASIKDLNNKFNISSDEAELTEGSVNLTVADALKQMITISHNYAAFILTDKIKPDNVATFLRQYQLNKSTFGSDNEPPSTTASDIALFLEKLYKGELANENSTNEMIDLLRKQQLNKKLPKDLPEEVEIAHKTGELGLFSHDAGIVYSPNGTYIIVVLTKTEFPNAASDRIADISKRVFDYFSQKKIN